MNTNRRSFLKGAAIASAPFILPSHIWAAETSPNSRPTIGFIGMGKQAQGLLGNFLYQDVQVLAVCDVDTTRRDAAKKKVDEYYVKNPAKGTPDCKAYNDFREIIARKDIDMVCIATPDHWHAVIVLAAVVSVIGSTMRLLLNRRRIEVEVLKLVGATNGFVRQPFVLEGATQGAAGATGALVLLGGLFLIVRGRFDHELANLLGVSPTFLPWPVAFGMVALGAILGATTALVSLRKMVAV